MRKLFLLSMLCALALSTACSEQVTDAVVSVDPNAGAPAPQAVTSRAPSPGLMSISLGGYTFDDNAFPDAASYVSGGPPTLSFATTGDINADLLLAADADPTTYIFGTPVVFDLTFVDNRLVNGAGADLVIFELGADDGAVVDIVVSGSLVGPLPYLMTPTGDTAGGFSLNAAAIDLDDFGIAAGTKIETIRINNNSALVPGGQTFSSAIAAVGALNSAPPVMTVDLDIKPGSFPNSINPKSKGVVPVAILGSAAFDVADIDVTTLLFGPAGATPKHDLTKPGLLNGHIEDVDGDGFLDLVVHFPQQDTGFGKLDTEGCLAGTLLDGTPIEGCDSIRAPGNNGVLAISPSR